MALPTHSKKHLKDNINIYSNYEGYIFEIHKRIIATSNDKELISLSNELIDCLKQLYTNQLEYFEFYCINNRST